MDDEAELKRLLLAIKDPNVCMVCKHLWAEYCVYSRNAMMLCERCADARWKPFKVSSFEEPDTPYAVPH